MAQQFPQKFGPYTLQQLIARGGMAEIYRATMQGIGTFEKMVAIKKILPHLVENEEFITMLIDEARILVGLNHANIAQVYDLGVIDETYYIAMEFVHGVDIATMIKVMGKQGQFIPFDHVAYIISCLCNGLYGAHSAMEDGRPLNIVHRDISPHNVLVSFGGEVKVIDFGVAKARSKDSSTKAGVIKGKLLYMAPEQAMAQDIDGRSDLFAAGLCMYKMLTHKLPFEGDNEFQIYNNILTKEIVPPKLIRPEVPEELNQIVMTLLQRDTDKRYQDGYAAKKDLDRALHRIAPGYTPSRLSRFVEDNYSQEMQAKRQADAAAAISAKTNAPPNMPSPPATPGFGPQSTMERVRTQSPQQQQGPLAQSGPQPPMNQFGNGFGAPNTPVPSLQAPAHMSSDHMRAAPMVGDTGEFGAAQHGLPPEPAKKPIILIIAVVGMALLFAGMLVAMALQDDTPTAPPTPKVQPKAPVTTPKAAVPAKIKVNITSEPAGATITNGDGDELGKTPMKATFDEDKLPMLLELRMDGYKLEPVKLTATNATHALTLTKKEDAPATDEKPETDTKPEADTKPATKPKPKPVVKPKPKVATKPKVTKPKVTKPKITKPKPKTTKPKKIKDIKIGW